MFLCNRLGLNVSTSDQVRYIKTCDPAQDHCLWILLKGNEHYKLQKTYQNIIYIKRKLDDVIYSHNGFIYSHMFCIYAFFFYKIRNMY